MGGDAWKVKSPLSHQEDVLNICTRLLLSHRTLPPAEIEHIPIEKALALGHGCKDS